MSSTVPSYCVCSAAEWAAAQERFLAVRSQAAWHAMAPFRRSTLAAQMACGQPISAELALEYADVIEARNYRPRVGNIVTTTAQGPEPGTLRQPDPDPYASHAPASRAHVQPVRKRDRDVG